MLPQLFIFPIKIDLFVRSEEKRAIATGTSHET
jgi:hypothetical protein